MIMARIQVWPRRPPQARPPLHCAAAILRVQGRAEGQPNHQVGEQDKRGCTRRLDRAWQGEFLIYTGALVCGLFTLRWLQAKSVHPNVDAVSGCLLYHYGLTEFKYYTVIFGVSRGTSFKLSWLNVCSPVCNFTSARMRVAIGMGSR